MYIYLAFALVGGFLLANQNPINADLRKIVGSPFLASGISNFVGSIFLGIITLVTTQELFQVFNLSAVTQLGSGLEGFLAEYF